MRRSRCPGAEPCGCRIFGFAWRAAVDFGAGWWWSGSGVPLSATGCWAGGFGDACARHSVAQLQGMAGLLLDPNTGAVQRCCGFFPGSGWGWLLVESAWCRVARARTAFARSLEQRLRALARANEVRVERARLKRRVAAGRIPLAGVVADPVGCANSVLPANRTFRRVWPSLCTPRGGGPDTPAPPPNSDFTITDNICRDNYDGGITLDPTRADDPTAVLGQRARVSGNVCRGRRRGKPL